MLTSLFSYTVNCEWEEWSPCSKFEEDCGDGSKPRRIRGEMTRKHKTQIDGAGNAVVTGPGGLCPGTVINGTEYDTKAPCYKDCPGNYFSVVIDLKIFTPYK